MSGATPKDKSQCVALECPECRKWLGKHLFLFSVPGWELTLTVATWNTRD